MSAKKVDPDAELDALQAQLESCKQQLNAPVVGAAPGAVAAFDPASILALISVISGFIDWFRNRKP
jgi:hypothetical protein